MPNKINKNIILFFILLATIAKAQTYYVSVTGVTDYHSLKEVYDVIPQPLTQNVEIILKNDGNSIPLILGETSFEWTKTGTNEFYIKIVSQDFDNPATITRYPSAIYMLVLKNVENIHFYNIIFENSSLGLMLDNVDYSSITSCQFIGNPILDDPIYQTQGGCGGASLWIGSNSEGENSEYNNITYNFFDGPRVNTYIRKHLYHSIYISYHSNHNNIIGNTIENPSGTGIVFNHSFQSNNSVLYNCINKVYEQASEVEYSNGDSINDCQGNPITYTTQGNGRDQFINSMQCIKISEGDATPPYDNQIINNYTFSDINNDGRYNIYDMNSNLIVDAGLEQTNIIENNHFDTQRKVYDSYWMNYQTDKVQNRILTGDFDNDGYQDDVATFYKYGNTETRIHMFRSNGSAFVYSGSSGWWSSQGYLSSQLVGMVSGDFDGDGYHDDIATFYKYGDTETRIHMFKSNGNAFVYSGSSGWWSSQGYLSSQIAGRIVSGDFDGDGHHDDIATFYKYGNTETRIHMFKSNGNAFVYSGSSGWWNNMSYSCDQITNRIASGDFNENGIRDDFMAIYSYSNQKSRTHVWNKVEGSNGFNHVNTSLGFPWIVNEATIIANRVITNSPKITNDKNAGSENISKLRIYPNPVKSILTIEYDTLPTEILLFNINGEIIKDIEIYNVEYEGDIIKIEISVGFLKTGLYILKIKSNQGTTIKKIAVE